MEEEIRVLDSLDSKYLSWVKIGRVYFEKCKMSDMNWNKHIGRLDNCVLTTCPNGGYIAIIAKPTFTPPEKLTLKNRILIFNGYGILMYSIPWSDNKFRSDYPLFKYSESGDLIILTPDSKLYVYNAWTTKGTYVMDNFVSEKAVLCGKQVYILGYFKANTSTSKEILRMKSYKHQ